ncbi:nucleoside transporter family [Metarhizium album ARSEF 1941]|uniref:Nucleoside transporter family n=1 Tax=Metarhizium album (strain ARSEF 1941) TaxID=1081103 RepID=A0A0B2X2H4_METAS|nr:nucleoside transporter family [Metarhizium album ARSEF 1941]KHN99450.1 nucleoside transporter family [Metarhizium album ARSEF 1941]
MNRSRPGRRSQAEQYEPLATSDGAAAEPAIPRDTTECPFSWMEYTIFGILGVAMLWAWNMFLAAAPYFSSRFAAAPSIQSTFQSAILTVSTITNLSALLVLSNLQYAASYPFRINLALTISTVVFALLTFSTTTFLAASPSAYFAFLLAMVALSSWATGLIQNGAFAFAASFGRPEYMQALMAGQGVAGVLPAVAQLTSVLLFPPDDDPDANPDANPGPAGKGETAAFLCFLAAVAVSVVTLVALIPLVRRHDRRLRGKLADRMAESTDSVHDVERAARRVTSLWALFLKLPWLAVGVAVTFAVTMFFPVFTAKIRSVDEGAGALFRPAAFVPLGFVFWNLGDLGGRVATMLPFTLGDRPFLLFLCSAARLAFLPLYLLCNVGGRGAVVPSDFFYLFVVQLTFGFTNGWLGSSFMMASGEWVDEGEREATGVFMGLCLVIGLTVGSLLSFTISDI